MTVVRIRKQTTERSVNEHWTSPDREAIDQEFAREQQAYPTGGYGTSIRDVRQDPTGLLWHAEFYRMTGCD